MSPQTQPLTTVQEIQFTLMRMASFNSFDGDRVVDDLLACRDLWQSVMMDREAFCYDGRPPFSHLISLRDMAGDVWNVDTAFILTSGVDDDRLEALIRKRWQADDIEFLTDEEASYALGAWPAPGRVLRVWWD